MAHRHTGGGSAEALSPPVRPCTRARAHMHTHARALTHTLTCTCTRTLTHADMCSHTHTYRHAHALTHACTRTHTHAHTHARALTCTHAHARMCTHAHSHTCTRSHACTCTHTCAHTNSHMHSHACTHKGGRRKPFNCSVFLRKPKSVFTIGGSYRKIKKRIFLAFELEVAEQAEQVTMAPLPSPKHGAGNDRPLSGTCTAATDAARYAATAGLSPRQGQGALTWWSTTRLAAGTAAHRTDPAHGGCPRRCAGWAQAPGGKVASCSPLHGGLCSADAQGEGAAGREGPRPPATSRGGGSRPRAPGKLRRAAVAGALRGSDPPGITGPWSEARGPPCHRDAACLGAPSQAVCPRRLRVRAPQNRPREGCVRVRGGAGGSGLGRPDEAEQMPFSSSPVTGVSSPTAAGSSGQRWFS